MISGLNEKELDIANQIADLLLEKEKLQQENKQLKKRNKEIYDGFMVAIDEVCETDREKRKYKQKIDKAIEFCNRYLSLNLDDFDSRKLLEKMLEILGDKE